jgi:hypothetical protein
MLKKSYVSASYLDPDNAKTYAFGKINGTIMADIDHNGFVDLITFPSNFTEAVHLRPVVWTNQGGFFTPSSTALKDPVPIQYVRDMVPGDFNNDGFTDYFLIDQGWELNNRDPNFLYGNFPGLLLGSSSGLTGQTVNSWLTNNDNIKTFNHIGDAADYDRDGDLDMVIAGFWDLRIYENLGQGKFAWSENILPAKFNGDNWPYHVSGATFIELNGTYAMVVGTYRAAMPAGTHIDYVKHVPYQPMTVLTYQNGNFTEAYTLARPNLEFGRERNYGVSDMYNMDLNGDGREDLVVTWETEAMLGIDDGMSNMSGVGNQGRYKDIDNTVITVYFQDANGRLVENNKFYNAGSNGSGVQVYFEDFNLDGYMDFWVSSYGTHPGNFDKQVYINDGRGNFNHPSQAMFSTNEPFPDWYTVSPFFFDANNDGAIDVVATRAVFSQPATRSIGEEVLTFLSDSPAYDITSNNKFLAVLKDKTWDGGRGIDTAVFSGRFKDYTITTDQAGRINTQDKIVGRDGKDVWINVERFRFDDTNIALDISPAQNAGSVYMLYKAAFNRAPDASGMGYWLSLKDKGADIVTSLAQGFVNAPEFVAKYGTNPSNASYVDKLYQNVLGRAGESGGVAYWNQELDAGNISKAAVLVQFATLAEGAANVASLIANGIPYTEFVG